MNDLLPDGIPLWHHVESALRKISRLYGYQEIRTPMLEKTSLFTQSIGDQTDIVEKEMYTFNDSSEESLSLRPEATASTVRACIQHGILHNRQQKLWYMGPMFRRERPQKGRYRQFHQFGIEAIGWPGPDVDAEIIRFGERIWRELEVEGVNLEINTLGSDKSRLGYRDALVDYLNDHLEELDEDSVRRLRRNPLRILDSKVPQTQDIVSNGPTILDFLESDEKSRFDRLCEMLDSSGIRFTISSRLVRGLDYYTSTVFEWTTDQLGAQGAVCAGGRYDSLVENRGGQPVPAIGFAMGMERLIEIVVNQGKFTPHNTAQIYMIDVTDGNSPVPVDLCENLRDKGFNVIAAHGGAKLKSQLKRADQAGAIIALIFGEREMANNVILVKHLRRRIEQQEIDLHRVVDWCQSNPDLN
jgi:histidyl-tRNA synthetase